MTTRLEHDLAELLHQRAHDVPVPAAPVAKLVRTGEHASAVRRRKTALTCAVAAAASVALVAASGALVLRHTAAGPTPASSASPAASTLTPAPAWAKDLGFPYVVHNTLYAKGTAQRVKADAFVGNGGTYFVRSGDGAQATWRRLDGTRLVPASYLDGQPNAVVSPDGSQVAFIALSGRRSSLEVHDVATGAEVAHRTLVSIVNNVRIFEGRRQPKYLAPRLLGYDQNSVLYWTDEGPTGKPDGPSLLWAWEIAADALHGPMSSGVPSYQATWSVNERGPLIQRGSGSESWRLDRSGRLADERPVVNAGDPVNANGVASGEPTTPAGGLPFRDVETGLTTLVPRPPDYREQIAWGLYVSYDRKYGIDADKADRVDLWSCAPAAGCRKLLQAPGMVRLATGPLSLG